MKKLLKSYILQLKLQNIAFKQLSDNLNNIILLRKIFSTFSSKTKLKKIAEKTSSENIK